MLQELYGSKKHPIMLILNQKMTKISLVKISNSVPYMDSFVLKINLDLTVICSSCTDVKKRLAAEMKPGHYLFVEGKNKY